MDLISLQAVIVNDPQFFQNICDFIVGGGTLVEFCDKHDLSYPACLRWLRLDPARRELYERAQSDRDEWQIDKLVRVLREMSDFNLADMMDSEGKQKPFHEWPASLQKAVSSIKKTDDGTEIKFFDKLKAVEMMGRKTAMFKDKVEHSGKVTLEHLVSQSKPGPPPKKDKKDG